ncbi:MAG: CBS domain-containing protein [Elusimicrobia bacterium]|nr:CBS domain-containing protein [Elusimicrobiota bacterium]
MHVRNIMTENPACCTPETNLQEVASLMVEYDCGAIPVVNDLEAKKPVGIVTDRDIVCRVLAEGTDPQTKTAGDCMTRLVMTVQQDTLVDDCCARMEESRIRRVPVVDDRGACCGIVSLADVARHAPKQQTLRLLREISQPFRTTSRMESGRTD